MIDPFTIGLVTYGVVTTRNRCKCCKKVRLFSSWKTWTCCNEPQCSECAEKTDRTKRCEHCTSKVK